MTVSVIIPTLNEADHIGRTLTSLRQQDPHEIIVVDGGSTDSTLEHLEGADRVLTSERGRAAQMNGGADIATGDVLLFLHADCELEAGSLESAEFELRRYRVVAGCFQMRVRSEGYLYRSIDFCATVRVRMTGLIYGDQGMFVSREMFDRVGGFPLLRLMEDVYISKELRRHGRIVVADRTIHVSPRRWQKAGIVRQTLRNWTLTALAGCGVHPDTLSTFYPIVR